MPAMSTRRAARLRWRKRSRLDIFSSWVTGIRMAWGCVYWTPDGKEVTPIMGCYGIGIERILTAAMEQNHDANGFWLDRSIAPFDVVVTVTNMGDANLAATAEQVATQARGSGIRGFAG